MQRVKPIYLSRTYNIPLPNPADPSESWKPEDLLDKMARMKGRLLKHGEPDREAVSKIILSDWVRGRIPFFVPPPDRPDELNAAEEKKRKLAEAKGKAKAKQQELPEVKQNLKTIMQKNVFVPEDIQPMDEEGQEEVEDEDVVGSGEEDEGESDVEDEEGEDDEDDDLKWDDVFEGINEDGPTESGTENDDEETAGGDNEGEAFSAAGGCTR